MLLFLDLSLTEIAVLLYIINIFGSAQYEKKKYFAGECKSTNKNTYGLILLDIDNHVDNNFKETLVHVYYRFIVNSRPQKIFAMMKCREVSDSVSSSATRNCFQCYYPNIRYVFLGIKSCTIL